MCKELQRDLGYESLEQFYLDSFEGVQARLEEYLFMHGEEIAAKRKNISEIKNTPAESVRPAPKVMKSAMVDGVYALDDVFAVLKKGGEFYLYNRDTGDISKRPMDVTELNKILKEVRAKGLSRHKKTTAKEMRCRAILL